MPRSERRSRDVADDFGFRFLALHLDCPVDIAQARIAAQAAVHAAGDRTPALVAKSAARFEALGPEAHRIDASRDPQTVCAEALATVRALMLPERVSGG